MNPTFNRLHVLFGNHKAWILSLMISILGSQNKYEKSGLLIENRNSRSIISSPD